MKLPESPAIKRLSIRSSAECLFTLSVVKQETLPLLGFCLNLWGCFRSTCRSPGGSVRKVDYITVKQVRIFVPWCNTGIGVLLITARIRRMGKVMFSVCPHLGGGVLNPRRSHGLSTPLPGLSTGGGGHSVGGGHSAGGVIQPGGYSARGVGTIRTTEWVLTTQRAVCLLRSRRRTFLL